MSVEIYHGDCRDVLDLIPSNTVDSCVTDPPYALVSIVKRFGSPNAAPAKGDVYRRASAGFMGQTWDTGEVAFSAGFWIEVLRVLKPGAHLVAFGSSRGYHRLACAIEDAGFEIRDSLMWIYSTGFPKSHNMDGAWEGWGTALKPAFEPIVLARKPLSEGTVAANLLRWGTGALNIAATRVGNEVRHAAYTSLAPCHGNRFGDADTAAARRGTQSEPKEYVGRWPANVVHDGSGEVVNTFPNTAPARKGKPRSSAKPGNGYGMTHTGAEYNDDGGSAARFFYSAKASKADRAGSKHPTVKPVDLMAWLCRLVTPPRGLVLDPFAGSGTTGAACEREGFDCILIERESEYIADIRRRFSSDLTPDAAGVSG